MMYESYAAVYDMSGQIRFSLLMESYLDDLLQRHPVGGRRALDLACGTGTLVLLLAAKGWNVIGIDVSDAMLRQAQAKVAGVAPEERPPFVQGDMRDMAAQFPPAMCDLATCVYDSLNYLLSEDDLAACIASVAHVLAPGGLFIGDTNTRHFLEHDWNPCRVREQKGYIELSQSHFDPQQTTSILHLTGFVGDDEQGYTRFDETHIERAYPPATLAAFFEQAGLRVEATYDCFTMQPPYATTQRIVWVVRKPATGSRAMDARR
jgi:SAM-dependent methyltransferase